LVDHSSDNGAQFSALSLALETASLNAENAEDSAADEDAARQIQEAESE
jgi:hypothetical protein